MLPFTLPAISFHRTHALSYCLIANGTFGKVFIILTFFFCIINSNKHLFSVRHAQVQSVL